MASSAFDFSGVSLAASDPNPTIDQMDDGGASSDFSSLASTAGNLGTEIAGIVSGSSLAPMAPAPTLLTSGIAPASAPQMSSTTMLLIAALFLGGVYWVIHSLK